MRNPMLVVSKGLTAGRLMSRDIRKLASRNKLQHIWTYICSAQEYFRWVGVSCLGCHFNEDDQAQVGPS
jgi:hypothetical protein